MKRAQSIKNSVRVAAMVVGLASVVGLATAGQARADDQPTRPESTWSIPRGSGPAQPDFITAAKYPHPEVSPPGVNDWSCRPTAAHPRPVVLVHGTWESAYQTWAGLSGRLRADGFCVFAPNVGILASADGGGVSASGNGGSYGAGPVVRSANQLAAFVSKVLTVTGSHQVDMVGHSQGGTLIRQYLKFNGGANPAAPQRNTVKNAITMVATNHGTTSLGLSSVRDVLVKQGLDADSFMTFVAGEAGKDQQVGSPVITALNAGGDTFPGISYTVLGTQYDEYGTPYYLTFLKAGPGAVVHNITVQDGCPQDLTSHTNFTYDPRAISYVRRALGVATPVVCQPQRWGAFA